MPTLTKTTKNFAARRGLDVTISEIEGQEALFIWEANNDMEPSIVYTVHPEHGFTLHSSIGLTEGFWDGLPSIIVDEQHLRDVLDLLATEVSA